VAGIVAGRRVPEVNRVVNAFIAGARKARPEVQILLGFTDAWDRNDLAAARRARHCGAPALWLGLVPRHRASGDRVTLGHISKRGDQHLRTLLVHGGRAVVRTAVRKTDAKSQWVNALVERRGVTRAIVAVANKNARTIWALLAHGGSYQRAA